MSEIKLFIENLISTYGYLGVYLGMLIESASIPLPSEVIMGFAGYLVSQHVFNLYLVSLVGALGNISGSSIMYVLGKYGGRPFAEKYGKYFHINKKTWEKSDKLFAKWGDEMVFVSQFLPGVRTFISFPSGILKVNVFKFLLYTFIGAFIWCLGLSWFGFYLGNNWELLTVYMHKYTYFLFILFCFILVIGVLIYKKHKNAHFN